jgi:hypothetical protein
MPKYFFDIHDGEHATVDNAGIDCADRKQVRSEAIQALPDIARDILPDGDNHSFSVRVRDDAGRYVFEASLTLIARWLDEEAGGHSQR